MLTKSSATPQGRLLSLFDILNDWLNAPNIQSEIKLEPHTNSLLMAFCTNQAKLLGADDPAMLAAYIVHIAQKATQQAINQPHSNSFAHAKKAAHALILAHTQKSWSASSLTQLKPVTYSIAASLLLVIGISISWLPVLAPDQLQQPRFTQNALIKKPSTMTAPSHDNRLSAYDSTQMYAKYEQIRQGTCQFPEALQIPDQHKAIYLNNVVGGELPSTLTDLVITNHYLEKVRCNFTPMLMAQSK